MRAEHPFLDHGTSTLPPISDFPSWPRRRGRSLALARACTVPALSVDVADAWPCESSV